MPDNPIQRLQAVGSHTEVWWDSSPLVYADWLAGPGRPYAEAELFTLVRPAPGSAQAPLFAAGSLLRGATTNQPLTWQVIEGQPATWRAYVRAEAAREGGLTPREAMWRLFIEVAAQGADRLAPLFKASGYRQGYICCQVDPRDLTDLDAMLGQARRIHAARPNIMVKMPGTAEGIKGVRILTAEGIPTNVTLGFTVSQLLAVGEAAQAGLAEAKTRGTDLRHWRSCAVMMLGRYEDAPPMKTQAAALGVALSEADIRWAGIAIFRKAHRLFRERGYPSQLMAASMRLGPVENGVRRVWHLEKLAGANAVLTVFPNIFEAFLAAYAGAALEPQIDEPVPDDVMERLLRLPYFATAYDEQGLDPADWANHVALQATAASFSEAMDKVQAFAASALSGDGSR